MPRTMKAAILRSIGASLSIEQVPVPEPKAGEVLIKVHAVSVNRTLDAVVRDCVLRFLRRAGVLAWLPLPGKRISIVWSAPQAVADELGLFEMGEGGLKEVKDATAFFASELGRTAALKGVNDLNRRLLHEVEPALLRLATCGSVDDGKSTLIGRLLYDSQLILDDQLASLRKESKNRMVGDEGIDFSLLVDGLVAEREQVVHDPDRLRCSRPELVVRAEFGQHCGDGTARIPFCD